MPSRRDQVQSYQYFMQRVISAFVVRDPEPTATPFARLGGAGLGSVMIAVICLGAVGVFGLMFPGGSTKWKDGASVIQEKETGTRYIYRDGKLRPVLNYASALLAMGSPAPTVRISRNSLVSVPRGTTIGIPYAPDSLPAAKRMLSGPWALCTKPAKDETGKLVATSVLTVGKPPSGGRSPADQGVLARDPKDNRMYLVWHDHRFQINEEKVVLEGLGLATAPVAMAGGAWLNALPAGQPIGTVKLDNIGKASTTAAKGTIGQVFVVTTQAGNKQYYLADSAALIPISQLQADIVLADPATRAAYPTGTGPQPVQLNAGTAASAPKRELTQEGANAPTQTPKIVGLTGDRPAMCASYSPGKSAPQVLLDADVPGVKEPVRTAGQTPEGTPLADRVVVRPGYGALVEAMPSPESKNGTVSLVTDLGLRYPMANGSVAGVLGYGKVKPIKLPASLVVRIPSGPSMDPDRATLSVDPE